MLYSFYEYHLRRKLESDEDLKKECAAKLFPREICFLLGEKEVAKDSLRISKVCEWCSVFPEIERVIFHISGEHPEVMAEYLPELEKISEKHSLTISTPKENRSFDERNTTPKVLIVFGKSGRKEITEAIIRIAEKGVEIENVTEEMIESHLDYKVNPDFVIKTGGDHLTDFLIWQSVYSELFFTDVNWSKFRKLDLYRALRDYQSRIRKFGK